MSFLSELKRRNVFRAGLAYGITAWLIAQVAGLAAAAFFAPDWVMKMIITVLVLGLPVAMLMAWAYELTPGGLRRESDIGADESTAQAMAGKLDKTITIALVLAVAYIAYDKLVLDPRRDAELLEGAAVQATQNVQQAEPAVEASVAAEEPPSIAVLPFVNMSDDAGNEYFSEGLSEELLNLLVRIPKLKVAARTSSFSYKGKDVKIAQIGQELNVAHVLEGSVRKAGNQVRITAQLIQADDGFHIWSETYDRTLDDIFVTQDEIAAAVVDALKLTLLGALPSVSETDPEVYALYLQGNYFNNQGGEEDLEFAVQAFKQALEIDPEYAPAWLGISYSYSNQVRFRYIDKVEGASLAMDAAEKALALDDSQAFAWSSMAYLKRTYEWDWESARAAMERALQLEPNNARVLGAAASLANTFGQQEKSISLFEQSIRLDPLNLATLRALGSRYRFVGQYDKSLETYNRLITLNPQYFTRHNDLGITYAYAGKPELALAEFEKISDPWFKPARLAWLYFRTGNREKAQGYLDELLSLSDPEVPLLTACIYAESGDNEKAFSWLDTAFEQHSPFLPFILGNPCFRQLDNDPRYPALLEKLSLLEYWKAIPPEHGGPPEAQ